MAKKGVTRPKSPSSADDSSVDPAKFLHFAECEEFSDDWTSLKLTDDDLIELQAAIMLGDVDSPLIEGAGGLRKMRFSPRRWNRGKRGALRVCFATFPQHHVVLLVLAYTHNERDNIDEADRQAIAQYIAEYGQELQRIADNQKKKSGINP